MCKIYALISHQTGTRTIASCPQMIELIQLMDNPTAVQKINKHVPVFQADTNVRVSKLSSFDHHVPSRCHGRGMQTRGRERADITEKKVLVGDMLATILS